MPAETLYTVRRHYRVARPVPHGLRHRLAGKRRVTARWVRAAALAAACKAVARGEWTLVVRAGKVSPDPGELTYRAGCVAVANPDGVTAVWLGAPDYRRSRGAVCQNALPQAVPLADGLLKGSGVLRRAWQAVRAAHASAVAAKRVYLTLTAHGLGIDAHPLVMADWLAEHGREALAQRLRTTWQDGTPRWRCLRLVVRHQAALLASPGK